MMTPLAVIDFKKYEAGMAAGAVEVRASLEGFLQQTVVKRAIPGSAECFNVDFFIQVAADGRAVTGNADAASAGGQRRTRDFLQKEQGRKDERNMFSWAIHVLSDFIARSVFSDEAISKSLS